ncbi:MAG: hypothetical protein NVS3B28_02740 [Candidatus Velthaea sp.]
MSAAREEWRVGETTLRVLQPDAPDFARLVGETTPAAYPVLKLAAEDRAAHVEKIRTILAAEPTLHYVGAYRGGELAGGMLLRDFMMRVRGAECRTGGLGLVAVDFAHKRRGVARDIVTGYLEWYARRGASLGALYPFRPSFYRKLGFGYGTKLDQYRVRPDALPDGGSRDDVRALNPGDAEAALTAYHRMQFETNGLLRRSLPTMQRMLADADVRAYGDIRADGRVRGYVMFTVALGRDGTQNTNEIVITEIVYEDPTALAALLAFLRVQGDQFGVVVVNTQDADFHVALDDPRNGSNRSLAFPAWHESNTQGVGIMYRIIDLAATLDQLGTARFGTLDARVGVRLTDPLLAANDGTFTLAFERGALALASDAGADLELTIGVADFSALLMGSLRLHSLVRFGRATLSEPAELATLDAAFATDPPQCKTRF